MIRATVAAEVTYRTSLLRCICARADRMLLEAPSTAGRMECNSVSLTS
jgi:hypothetical protein